MFKYDYDSLRRVAQGVDFANRELNGIGLHDAVTSLFTTSPSLTAVSTQYASYLLGHPGSLAVATTAAISNVGWLYDSLVPLAKSLRAQEIASEGAFKMMLEFDESMEEFENYILPSRVETPILDLGYVPPIAAVEAVTPLKALTVMFAGDDSGIVSAANSWSKSAGKMIVASELLRSAASSLASTTEGEVFTNIYAGISTIAEQCAVVSANSTAMATSMLQLPPIRAAAHTQLVAMELELAAEATAAGAATGGAGAAAIAAKSQAQVAAFVAGYLQPALDTARPLVTNLSVPVTSHTGGGALTSAGAATMAAEEAITQVAGGAATPAATQAAAQPNAVAQQASQIGAAPAAANQAAPVGQSPMGPTGGAYGAPGGAQAGSPTSMVAGQNQALGAVGGRGTPTVTPGTAAPGATTGLRGGVPGSVAQPLLPRGVSTATPRSPGAMPLAGAGGSSSPGAGAAHGGAGARGGVPAAGGAAPVSGSNNAAGQRAGGNGMAAGAGAAGAAGAAGQKGAAGRAGKGKSPGALFGKTGQGTSRQRCKKSLGSSLLDSYFRREYLGDKETTVRKVIR